MAEDRPQQVGQGAGEKPQQVGPQGGVTSQKEETLDRATPQQDGEAARQAQRDGISRRRFLQGSAAAPIALVLAGSALSWVYLRPGEARAFTLRPPGALEPRRFLAACVRCGKCAQACPYQAIRLADRGAGLGTPLIVARDNPCLLCTDLPCVKACPSGALDPRLDAVEKVRMGTAVIVDRESCLSIRGLRCEVCYRQCPLIDQAITIEARHNPRTGEHSILEPVVHKEKCVGCGVCEKACVLPQPAIVVQARVESQRDSYDF